MSDSAYLESYFGTRELSALSPDQLASGKSRLLEAITEAHTQEEEIHLWIIANSLGIAPPPGELRFTEARIYARTISMVPPTVRQP